MKVYWKSGLFLLLISGLVGLRTVSAQDAGQVLGTVTDPSGAIVPGIAVTATNLGTNASQTVTSGQGGSFLIPNLPPAQYLISTAPLQGFSAYRTQIEVTVGGRMTVDVRLSTTAETTINVASQGGVQVNTDTAELSQVIDHTQITQLPSLTRNPYDFVQLSGNVSAGDATASGASENVVSRGVGVSISGQRSTGTEILLDGVENVQIFSQAVGIKVPIDAVQEFSVITSNFQPQYGRASGGVVNVSTVAGSNKFHGKLWEFNRLAAYTANTVTNAQSGTPKGGYTRNQFGFTVGGPVRKDKLFFFASTEWIRVRSAANLAASVPTPQFLALSAPNVQAYFSQYSGNPSFNFSNTTSASDLGFTGVPANTPVFGRVNYSVPADAGGGVPQNTYNIVGRADYNLSQNSQFYFRYVDYSEVDSIGSASYSPYSQYNTGLSNKSQAYLLSLTHNLFTCPLFG